MRCFLPFCVSPGFQKYAPTLSSIEILSKDNPATYGILCTLNATNLESCVYLCVLFFSCLVYCCHFYSHLSPPLLILDALFITPLLGLTERVWLNKTESGTGSLISKTVTFKR